MDIQCIIIPYTKISNHTLTAVPKINIARIYCKYVVLMFLPVLAPKGDAIRLATTIIIAGSHVTCPVTTLLAEVPIEEIKVMASEEAIVILVGIFKITSIIGTSKKEPPAPTIPAPTPTNQANKEPRPRLNVC